MTEHRYMNAAILEATGSPLRYVEGIKIPKLNSGQVLVRVAYSGICGSQLMEISGGRGVDKFLPHLLGHEASGEVIDIAPNVTKVKPGDTVILSWIRGTGISANPAKYSHEGSSINSGQISTLSNYSIVSENTVFKHESNVPTRNLALLGCAIPTGCGIILNQLPEKLENFTLAIFGLGGVGMSALLAASTRKPARIIGVDVDSERLRALGEFVDFIPVNPKKSNVRDVIQRETHGLGVDFSIDASGSSQSIELAFSLTRTNGGKIIVASHPKSGERISIDPYDLVSGKHLLGTWGGMVNMDSQLELLNKIYLVNKSAYDWMSQSIYPLSEVNKALDDMRNSRVVRPIIEMHH